MNDLRWIVMACCMAGTTGCLGPTERGLLDVPDASGPAADTDGVRPEPEDRPREGEEGSACRPDAVQPCASGLGCLVDVRSCVGIYRCVRLCSAQSECETGICCQSHFWRDGMGQHPGACQRACDPDDRLPDPDGGVDGGADDARSTDGASEEPGPDRDGDDDSIAIRLGQR